MQHGRVGNQPGNNYCKRPPSTNHARASRSRDIITHLSQFKLMSATARACDCACVHVAVCVCVCVCVTVYVSRRPALGVAMHSTERVWQAYRHGCVCSLSESRFVFWGQKLVHTLPHFARTSQRGHMLLQPGTCARTKENKDCNYNCRCLLESCTCSYWCGIVVWQTA